jgi:hypothetical protein
LNIWKRKLFSVKAGNNSESCFTLNKVLVITLSFESEMVLES